MVQKPLSTQLPTEVISGHVMRLDFFHNFRDTNFDGVQAIHCISQTVKYPAYESMTGAETITKRLHIGGLKPEITTVHLKDRFSIFGTVKDVEELQPDALGMSRVYIYIIMR